MADLSKTTIRGTTQGRLTENRDRLITTARTERESIRVLADQRDAATGDARADDIRRSLGMLNQTGQQIGQQIIENRREGDTASGSADGLTGAMDPAKAKHRAYADAFYTANAVATSTTWQTAIGEHLQQLASDPTKSPADIEAEFAAISAERVKQIKEQYGASPAAQAAAAKALVAWTADVQPKLHAAIKDRTDDQLLSDTVTGVTATIASGKPVDFVGIETKLAAGGVDRAKIKDRLFQAALVAATDPTNPNPEIAKEAAKALTPAVGDHPAQSFFTPQQITQLRNAQIQADNQRDHNEKEGQKAAMTTFEEGVIKSGNRNFLPDLIKLRDGGKITVDQFNDVAGTLNRAFNTVEDGFVDERALLDLKRMMIVPNPNWSAIQTAARKANLGTGTAAENARLSVLLDAAQGIRSDQARAEARANARTGAPRMGFMEQNNYQAGYSILASVAPPKDASVAEQTAYYQAVAKFRSTAEANPGQDHIKAATDAIDSYTKTKHSVSQARAYQGQLTGTVTRTGGKTPTVTPGDMQSLLGGGSHPKPPSTAMVFDRNGNRIQ